jgi:hypothetical protein
MDIGQARENRRDGDGMGWHVDWRRVAAGSAALLLHLLLVLALLTATGIVPLQVGQPHEILLTLPAPQQAKQKEKEPIPVVPEHVPIPELSFPTFQPQAITVLPPPPSPQKESTPEGDIGALGRYLFNCSGENFEAMSERERSHCLANKWEKGKQVHEPVLGEAKPSQFDQVIKERQAPFVPPFQGCDPASINASLHNVPCTNFSSGHDILQEVPGH